MTCILGAVHDGKVYMGGDSQVSFSWHAEQQAIPKVFRVGPFLMGSTGDVRLANIIRFHLDIPNQVLGEDDDHYIIVSLVEHIRLRAKELGYAQIDKNREGLESGAVLIGYQAHIYQMASDYSVTRNGADVSAIGSGYPFALGAFEALKRTPIAIRVRRSLEIAARYAYGVDHKINIEVIS